MECHEVFDGMFYCLMLSAFSSFSLCALSIIYEVVVTTQDGENTPENGTLASTRLKPILGRRKYTHSQPGSSGLNPSTRQHARITISPSQRNPKGVVFKVLCSFETLVSFYSRTGGAMVTEPGGRAVYRGSCEGCGIAC